MAILNNEKDKESAHLTPTDFDACTFFQHGGGIHIHHGNDVSDIKKDVLFLKGVYKSWCMWYSVKHLRTIEHHHNSATKSLGVIYSILKI